jgi:sugar/nucleoside kinase (ribokinase family)
MGEILVEIMRPRPDMPLNVPDIFQGPYPSGAPANFIDAVARLGHPAGIIGGVGDDAFGHLTIARMESNGVDTRLIRVDPNGTTGVAFVAYESNGERSFIFHMGGTPATSATCPNAVDVSSPAPAYFHIMGCSLMADEGFCKEIIQAAELFRGLGAKISFDPNIRPELLYGRSFCDITAPIMTHCSVLLPGLEELMSLAGKNNADDAIQTLFENPALEIIALKRGSQGCRIVTRQEDFTLGVYPIVPVDPTGAGDAFDAGFLCGLLDKLPLADAARQASAAAALCTAALGPMEGNITPDGVVRMIQANPI